MSARPLDTQMGDSGIDSGHLVVRGSGYSKNRPPRGPFVMPSAPIKAKVAMAPNREVRSTSASRRIPSNNNICSCQHPADIAFLQDVYVENMRMRVEMLELENNYLRGRPAEERQTNRGTEERQTNRDQINRPDERLNASDRIRKRVDFADKQPLETNDRISHENLLQNRISQLNAEKSSMENRIQEFEEKRKISDRMLMEENVQLRRRLDDLTPLVASKDAEIERLEMEKAELRTRRRGLNITEEAKSAVDLARQSEVADLRERLKRSQELLEESQNRAVEMKNRISETERRLLEEKAITQREISLKETLIKENSILTKENSELRNRMERNEFSRKSDVDLEISQSNERRLKDELAASEKKWRIEKENRISLEEQLAERDRDDQTVTESRRRTHEELQGLRALSESLSAENHGLREEKMAAADRSDLLLKKLKEKSKSLNSLLQWLTELRSSHVVVTEQITDLMLKQSASDNRLEEIFRNTQQLGEFTSPPSSDRPKSRQSSVGEFRRKLS